MTDDSGEIVRGEVLYLTQERAWWQRPASVIFLVALSFSLLLFAVGSFVDRWTSHNANADLRTVAAELKIQNDELVKDNDELRLEQECRAQRNAELAAFTSDVTGAQAQLVVLIIQRIQDPDSYLPVLADLQNVAEQRRVARDRLVAAVAECQAPS
jgi:hypothetical protein